MAGDRTGAGRYARTEMSALGNDRSQVHLDVDLLEDPLPGPALHELLAEARRTDGLVTVGFLGTRAHLVTRSEDLLAFLTDDECFPGETMYRTTVELQVGETFISMERPRHDHYRALTTPAFRSRSVARFIDDDLVPLAHEVVDRFAARGRADLVEEFARVMPFWAISRKLGLPRRDEERLRRLAYALFGRRFSAVDPRVAVEEITAMIRPELHRRRLEPGDDVLSQLVTARRDEQVLTDDEIINHVRLLFAVGATTTSDSLANLLWAVLSLPGLLEETTSNPSIRPGVVAESLRMEPAVPVLPRLAAHGGVLCGTRIPAGGYLLAGLAGANREADRFPEPDRFDPTRDPDTLFSFGFGAKYCPGTHLARQQLLAALDVIVDRLPGLHLIDATPPSGSVLRSTDRVIAGWSVP